MTLTVRHATGLEYLALVTALLQRARRADPTGGVWEAADLQWWWRHDQHRDAAAQTFWCDGDGPVGAIVFGAWPREKTLDVLSVERALALEVLWPHAAALVVDHDERLLTTIRDDDPDAVEAAGCAGLAATDEVGVATTMASADRPAVPELPSGFELVSRADGERPHPMIARNGTHVAERLDDCPLYRRSLDLAISGPDGVAAYGLFWADPLTRIGLVEPMRTEERYQGRGLGRAVLAEGLERLARAGCETLKVTYMTDNEASRRLYLAAGFRPVAASRTYVREPSVTPRRT